MKKIIAIFMTVFLAATMLPFALADETVSLASGTGGSGFELVKDVPADYWGREALSTLYADNIMTGYQNYMRPEANITRGEFCAVVNRTFGFSKTEGAETFSDVNYADKTWKTTAIEIASSQGYLKGTGGKALADQSITREQAFTILSRVLKQDPVKGGTTFSDDAQISSWAREQVNAMWESGYVKGDQNKINPQGDITRAETAQVVCNVMGIRISAAGTYDFSGIAISNMTVTHDGAVIKNAGIKGNLYITEGVGTGSAAFERCAVSGNTVISGGGTHSILLTDTTAGSVKIEVPEGAPARLALSGNSQTGTLTVNSSALLDTSANTGAGIPFVTIHVPEGAAVSLSGTFASVEVNSPVNLTLDEKAVVNSLTVNSTIAVQGAGTINKATVNANNVKFQVMPKSVSVGENVTIPPAETGGGTGGNNGGGVTPTYNVTGVTLYGSFPDASAVSANGKWVFDLTNTAAYPDSDTISKIKISTNGASHFKIQDVGEVPTNQDVTITDALNVLNLDGPSAVSFRALRSMGSQLAITGAINGVSVTIVFQVSDETVAYYKYSFTGSAITAALLHDTTTDDFVSQFGVDPVALALLRYTPQDTSGSYLVTAAKGGASVTRSYTDYHDMTDGLQSQGMIDRLNESHLHINQLSDLTGYTVTVTHKGIVLVKIVFAE